jgi:hypothetical protein
MNEKDVADVGTDLGGIRIWMESIAQELAIRAANVYFGPCTQSQHWFLNDWETKEATQENGLCGQSRT